MPHLIPLVEARSVVLENATLMPVERVSLLSAVGRVVAEPLYSDIDVNAFDDASMDGFAIIGEDVAAASADHPVELDIVNVVGAGYVHDGVLQHGQAVRIMTGAAMPDGADTNVKIEEVQTTGAGLVGDKLVIASPVKTGANVRKAGEEAKAGQLVMEAGTKLTPAHVGLLATIGNIEVPVYRRPVVGVMSIGTELVEPGEVPGKGMRRDSNRYTMAAMAIDAGAEAKLYPIVADEPDAIRAQYERAVSECDYVVSSGGACGGDFDYISSIIASLASVKFEYVNMRPGKAQTFGVAPDGTMLFGLSGNPAASATGFEMLVRPALRKAQGHTEFDRPVTRARFGEGTGRKHGNRLFFMRGTLSYDGVAEGDVPTAVPMGKQSSQLIGETAKSNCFIAIPDGDGNVEAGDLVDCVRIDMEEGTLI